MHYQTLGLMVSQVVTGFVTAIKQPEAPASYILCGIAFVLTFLRTISMERTYALETRRLPLQRLPEIDGERGDAAAASSHSEQRMSMHLYEMAAKQKPGTATLVDGIEGALGVGLSLVGRSADRGLGLAAGGLGLAANLVQPLVERAVEVTVGGSAHGSSGSPSQTRRADAPDEGAPAADWGPEQST